MPEDVFDYASQISLILGKNEQHRERSPLHCPEFRPQKYGESPRFLGLNGAKG